jgi:serine/threonine-protein kinase
LGWTANILTVTGQAAVDGTPFGRYRLVELLGRGGMGEVWRAFDTATERLVALKVLPANFAHDQVFQERFRREARVAAGLDEPHVVPIHDFGEIEGRFFVSMRLIHGEDLHTLLSSGALEPTRAVAIIGQVAAALHAAHRIGLVHRDVKPSNILVGEDDFAYLIDFGIARAAAETGLTNTGATVGTWAYMAPERFKTGAADARADVYSLACVLYECLTGAQPYPGGSLEQQMHAHLYLDPPQPSEKRPGIPTGFDEVVARGMDKQPGRRFATTKHLADAARAALTTKTAVAPAAEAANTADATKSAERSSAPAGSLPQPPNTRRFSQWWPNPEGTGSTPNQDHTQQPDPPPARRSVGRGPLLLAGGGGLMLLAALLVATLIIVREHNNAGRNGNNPENQSTTSATSLTFPNTTSPTSATTKSATTTAQLRISNLPGTDNLGWTDYPSARCDPGTQPAVMARTTQSVLVVCQIQPGNFYYRGVRLSDGASIELANAVRSSQGFDVTNPTDGTRYQIRPTSLAIVPPAGQASTEPMLEYASG